MHENDTKWAVLHGQSHTEWKAISAGGGRQQESVCPPLSSASCVKNETFGNWHNCDGAMSSCQKPSSLLRNLAFNLRQKERALSASWEHLLPAINAVCDAKTHRRMPSYQTECYTWQEHGGWGGGYTDNGVSMLNWVNIPLLIERISLISPRRWKHHFLHFFSSTLSGFSHQHTEGEFTNTHECTKHSLLLPPVWKTNLFLFLFVVNLHGKFMKRWKKQSSMSSLWTYNKANIQILSKRHQSRWWNESARRTFANIQSL